VTFHEILILSNTYVRKPICHRVPDTCPMTCNSSPTGPEWDSSFQSFQLRKELCPVSEAFCSIQNIKRWANCSNQWIVIASLLRRGLWRKSAAACLLRLWVRIPPGAWMSLCCGECCVLSGREVSATSCSLVQRSPTDCDVSLCVI
jgi:hypothetical protein